MLLAAALAGALLFAGVFTATLVMPAASTLLHVSSGGSGESN